MHPTGSKTSKVMKALGFLEGGKVHLNRQEGKKSFKEE